MNHRHRDLPGIPPLHILRRVQLHRPNPLPYPLQVMPIPIRQFKEYRNWKKDMGLLEFELSRFEGVPYEDVIRSMCLGQPQGEKVQGGGQTDKIGEAVAKIVDLEKEVEMALQVAVMLFAVFGSISPL